MPERQPRNHTARVAALQHLETEGLLEFIESRRSDSGRWEYVVQVTGDTKKSRIPTSQIDTFLATFRLALAACAAARHPDHSTGTQPTPLTALDTPPQ
jgi:hypothetical protein